MPFKKQQTYEPFIKVMYAEKNGRKYLVNYTNEIGVYHEQKKNPI